jgi:hypothetical protein
MTKQVTSNHEKEARSLTKIVRAYLGTSQEYLESERIEAKRRIKDEDWPWNGFIISFSTLGGSKNWEQKIRPRSAEFTWSAIENLSNTERAKLFFSLPNPRFRKRVAEFLAQCWHEFENAGGPSQIKRKYFKLETAHDRIQYLKSFPGIGEKYARNIAMDVCDPLVSEHFALDHRLKSLVKSAVKRNLEYSEAESFLKIVADRLCVDCWTLDRVLYRNYEPISRELATSKDD